jgi:hypothetical protein
VGGGWWRGHAWGRGRETGVGSVQRQRIGNGGGEEVVGGGGRWRGHAPTRGHGCHTCRSRPCTSLSSFSPSCTAALAASLCSARSRHRVSAAAADARAASSSASRAATVALAPSRDAVRADTVSCVRGRVREGCHVAWPPALRKAGYEHAEASSPSKQKNNMAGTGSGCGVLRHPAATVEVHPRQHTAAQQVTRVQCVGQGQQHATSAPQDTPPPPPSRPARRAPGGQSGPTAAPPPPPRGPAGLRAAPLRRRRRPRWPPRTARAPPPGAALTRAARRRRLPAPPVPRSTGSAGRPARGRPRPWRSRTPRLPQPAQLQAPAVPAPPDDGGTGGRKRWGEVVERRRRGGEGGGREKRYEGIGREGGIEAREEVGGGENWWGGIGRDEGARSGLEGGGNTLSTHPTQSTLPSTHLLLRCSQHVPSRLQGRSTVLQPRLVRRHLRPHLRQVTRGGLRPLQRVIPRGGCAGGRLAQPGCFKGSSGLQGTHLSERRTQGGARQVSVCARTQHSTPKPNNHTALHRTTPHHTTPHHTTPHHTTSYHTIPHHTNPSPRHAKRSFGMDRILPASPHAEERPREHHPAPPRGAAERQRQRPTVTHPCLQASHLRAVRLPGLN